MDEIWVNIKYSESHQVSNFGRVRSVDIEQLVNNRWGGKTRRIIKGRILKPWLAGAGYAAVRFVVGGKNHYVHRLVAEHFIAGDAALEVNHRDGVKTNNHFLNLEWANSAENSKHSYHVLGNKKGSFAKAEKDYLGRWTGKGIRHG